MNCLNTIADWVGIRAIPSLLELPNNETDVVLDVPSYSQIDGFSCGAIAAWSIVETFHPEASFKKFYNAVGPNEEDGIGPRGVIKALRAFKVGTHYRRNLAWKDLTNIIDEGFPMLIGTGKNHPELKGDHWSLLYGYGTRRYRKVFLGNQIGVLRNQAVVSWTDFVTDWWNPKGQAIVCWGE